MQENLFVKAMYDASSGTSEGYSVGQHSALAVMIYESQIGFFKLNEIQKPSFVSNPYRFLKFLVAYHDIGKSISVKLYKNNSQEITYSSPMAFNLMQESGFSVEEARLASSLIALHKVIGEYLKDSTAINLKSSVSSIKKWSLLNGVSSNVFFKYLEILFYADAGAYPYLARNVFTTNAQGQMIVKNTKAVEELRKAIQ